MLSFSCAILSLYMSTTPVLFSGCVYVVNAECPECGSGVQAVATIGTILALYKIVEKYNINRVSLSDQGGTA